MTHQTNQPKDAKRGPMISIAIYILLSLAKLITGHWLHSSALIADGFNNLSDIIGNITILIGLYLANKPADSDHRFGHWKIEDLASLLTSIIMFMAGFQVLIDTIQLLMTTQPTPIDPIGALVGFLSSLVMYGLYRYNHRLAEQVKSGALIAAAKDNLADALTSFGTSIAILASYFNWPIIDKVVAIIITLFILKTAYDIFISSSFSLSDGFDNDHLLRYEAAILEIPKITAVKSQRGRTYGSNVYLDLVLEMNPDLSVYESHEITEQVETLLREQFDIHDIDIHVEPGAIPEDEIFDHVYQKLIKYEKIILSRIPDYEQLISEDFQAITANGHLLDKARFMTEASSTENTFSQFQMVSISQKTKLVNYCLLGKQHTSIWRRHEQWLLIYHQITPEQER